MKQPVDYILASKKNGALYVGVTSGLVQRAWCHREHPIDGFSKRYDVTRLVWYEVCEDMLSAIAREKQFKNWKRQWKIQLIQKENPQWRDLFEDIT